MALTPYWEISFRLDGCYNSYNELIQGALDDDVYQKYFPGIGLDVLLENIKKFVQDPNNRPTKDGVRNGTLYKKENGRQIDSTRRYYLVKEENLDEFNLYVKITKGRNLGFYRVYNNEQEVEILIQFSLNQLKNDGQLPIVADYTSFALNKKFYVSRERCEFISRLLNANTVATRNRTKVDYDVTKLGARQKTQKNKLVTVQGTTTTSIVSSSSTCRGIVNAGSSNTSPQHSSSNTTPQHSSSTVAQTTSKRIFNITKTALHSNTKGKNNSSTAKIRSTPMPNRLRVRKNGKVAAASSSSSRPDLVTKPKINQTTVSVEKKRGHMSDDEENDENDKGASDLHIVTTRTNRKLMRVKKGGSTNKRIKN